MVRTQVYLTEIQQQGLRSLSKHMDKPQSELIRLALDAFIHSHSREDRLQALRAARGLWKKKGKEVNFKTLRESWDRF